MDNAKIAEKVNDRELFSEPLEPPINPLLIHMVPPFMAVKDPMFCLQINGEVVWESRKVYSYRRMTFYLLQRSILLLGYQLSQSSGESVGIIAVAASIRRFCQKVQAITNGKIRKRLKVETWVKLAIHPEEIQRTPNDIMAQLTQQNSNLSTTVEERAAELYDEIHHELAHTRKEFHDVGKIRQQLRHLAQIQ